MDAPPDVWGDVRLEFNVLGPLQVIDGGAPVPLGPARPRSLLAALLCRPGEPVSVDSLIEEFWPATPPRTARKTVQAHVCRLRHALGDGRRIRFDRVGYLIALQPGELDSQRVAGVLADSRALRRRGELDHASRRLTAALALWRGTAFGDVHGGALVDAEAARLAELRLLMAEERAEVDVERGLGAELVPELDGLMHDHPFRERLRAALMRSLCGAGQAARALETYRGGRRLLREELGVEPGPELRAAHEAVLRNDTVAVSRGTRGRTAPQGTVPGGVAPRGKVRDAARQPSFPLPPDIADFTGRSGQAGQIATELGPPAPGTAPPVVVVSGAAGTGKTALALRVAHRLGPAYPDGQLFIDLHGSGPRPVATGEALRRFLRVLTVEAPTGCDLDESAERYRLALSGRRVLVILDDVGSLGQVQPLLPGDRRCGVLVTSRRKLAGPAGAYRVDLGGMSEPEALELLGRIAGQERVDADPPAAVELVRLCDRLPLALRIAGERLATRAHWSVRAMVRRIERHRLDELEVGELSIRATIGTAYQGLDQAARGAFRLVGLLAPGAFTTHTVASVLGLPPGVADQVVERLADARLVEADRFAYRMPGLVRAYARERFDAEDR